MGRQRWRGGSKRELLEMVWAIHRGAVAAKEATEHMMPAPSIRLSWKDALAAYRRRIRGRNGVNEVWQEVQLRAEAPSPKLQKAKVEEPISSWSNSLLVEDPIAHTVAPKVSLTNQSASRQRRKLWFTIRINTTPRKTKAMDRFIEKKNNMKARTCISLSWASFRPRSSRNGVPFIPNHVQEVEALGLRLLRYRDIRNHSERIRKCENWMARKSRIWISWPEIQLIKCP